MLLFNKIDKDQLPDSSELETIAQFLFRHLENYGDALDDIKNALQYALAINGQPGGFIITVKEHEELIAVAVVLNTLMKGFIPEHILVYIATHQKARGKGVGSQLMKQIIDETDGDIALHVEANNPAIALYEKFGFKTPYLEMRLKKTN